MSSSMQQMRLDSDSTIDAMKSQSPNKVKLHILVIKSMKNSHFFENNVF